MCDNYDERCNNIEKKFSAEFTSMKHKRQFPVLEIYQNQHEKTNLVAGWIQCRKKSSNFIACSALPQCIADICDSWMKIKENYV